MARIVQGNIVAFRSEKRMSESLSSDIQRFQVHYSLKEILEVQDFLNDAFERSKHHGDLQDLYRRRYGCPVLLQGSTTDRRFVACLLNPGRQRMPRLPETCVSSSLGQTAPKLVNSQCKYLDQIYHISAFYPTIIIHYPSFFLFFILHSPPCISHLNLGSFCHFVMHLPGNIVYRHISILAAFLSSVTVIRIVIRLIITTTTTPICTCDRSEMSALLNDTLVFYRR